MRNTILITLVLFCIFSSRIYAQKEAAVWHFGFKDGLDFNYTPPKPIKGSMLTLESAASICTRHGKLLFYTNGDTVWNSHHQPMPNGTGLIGDSQTAQGALIIPQPSRPNIYYVFTINPYAKFTFYCSVVDMNMDYGNGDVISKNKLLSNNIVTNTYRTAIAEFMTAVRHANGRDVWIFIRNITCFRERPWDDTGEFNAFLLTEKGLNETPVKSPMMGYPSLQMGQMKISPDGKFLAMGRS